VYICDAEQDEIADSKRTEDVLTWEDVSRMKYTWKAAMETLRTVPPVFGSFRTATKDIEYQGYHIPRGWKVCAFKCTRVQLRVSFVRIH
jgi:cytochrome P450